MIKRHAVVTCLFAILISACASESGGGAEFGGGTRAEFCKSGDTPVASPSQCLQDDAACYQLTDNSWCTGERGLSCPTGSTPLAEGAECPRGARCFNVSESMRCVVTY